MKKTDSRLQIWESALLISLCFTLLSGLWARSAQAKLSREIVRLHVIAESDSERDQAIKLKVRDAVLKYLEPKLAGTKSAEEANFIINEELEAINAIAQSTVMFEGRLCKTEAGISIEHYPSRLYDSFSLPAGDYVSLRVILGEGKGQNWWCVVFPPLCLESAQSETAFSELSDENARLITADSGKYVLKFRIIELFDLLRGAFS